MFNFTKASSFIYAAFSLVLTIGSFAHAAAPAKASGTVYICSNANNDVKITADLSDQKKDRLAVVYADDLKQVYNEFNHKKLLNLFLVGATKNVTLEIKKTAKAAAAVTLEVDPDNSHSQLAHSGEGVTITKFEASLTVPSLKLNKEVVSCLETKWTD